MEEQINTEERSMCGHPGVEQDEETESRLLIFDRNGSGTIHWVKLNDTTDGFSTSSINHEMWDDLHELTDFGVTTLDNNLYIIGGRHVKSGECLNHLLQFNPTENCWTERTCMTIGRCRFAAVTVDGSIHVIGGERTDGKPTGSCEMYDSKSDTWRKSGMLPLPRCCHACVKGKYDLYVSGGQKNAKGKRNLWIYEKHRWNELDEDYPLKLTHGTERHMSAWLDNTLYIIGGLRYTQGEKDGVGRVESKLESLIPTVSRRKHGCDDAVISPWSNQLPRMKHARHSAACVVMGRRLFVLGGTDAQGESVQQVEYYDVDDAKWRLSLLLPDSGDFRNVTCCILRFPKSKPPNNSDSQGEVLKKWAMW